MTDGVEFGAEGDARATDPRADRPDPPVDPGIDDALPRVARASTGAPLALLIGGPVLAGVLLFAWLNAGRQARHAEGPSSLPAARSVEAPPPPLQVDPPTVLPPATVAALPPAQAVVRAATPLPLSPQTAFTPLGPRSTSLPEAAQRVRAPAMVVDLSTPDPTDAAKQAAGAAAKPGTGLGGGGAAPVKLSDDESFANRVDQGEVARARTTQLGPLDHLIPQGAVITAVVENAINSDLPGYARAVVSRDVRSFDGSNVLIPRGSRLIGQYKSGEALGASRVFVIWTRVIRADGVSIQIGSPATDPLGRGGLTGKIDRHFFQRFGGAILLSVLSAGTQALANSAQPTAQVNIGNSSDASSVAAAALQQNGTTPPTITVQQGAAIRVFVARDLDFTLAPVTPAP